MARSANSEPSGAPAKTSGSARNTWAKSQAQRLRVGEGVVLIGVVVAAAADGGKAELITGRGGWTSVGRLGRQRRHNLSPQSGVAREDAKIPQSMQPRRGHRRDQAGARHAASQTLAIQAHGGREADDPHHAAAARGKRELTLGLERYEDLTTLVRDARTRGACGWKHCDAHRQERRAPLLSGRNAAPAALLAEVRSHIFLAAFAIG